jgi:repressor LexA
MPLNLAGDGQKLGRLAQVLRAIEAYLRRYDRSPTVRDLCHETGILSTSYVFYLLARLELDGYITREAGVSRSIRLTRPAGVPIVGTIAAGLPLDLFDTGEPETLDLAAHARAGDGAGAEYALRVRGDSMIEDGIFDGDYVLVRPARTAPEGAIVVAVHLASEGGEHGAATLKRLQLDRRHKCVLLCPANAALRAIEIPMKVWRREWAVQGTVMAIYRPYSQFGQFGPSRPRPYSTQPRTC